MITYIIKFILCSGLLLLVYRVFLGNERLYRFNRFYLLFSLVFSLAVPFVTISVPAIQIPYLDKFIAPQAPIAAAPIEQTAPVIINEPTIQQDAPTIITSEPAQQPIVQTPATDYLPYILLGTYGIAVLILLLRFAKNSWHISHLVTKNTIIDYQDTKLVLIDEEVTPHSFLNYVFINKDAYQSGGVEPEIICHEQAHVRQMHSLDVIFVELLQVVFWFNPFIPFYRKTIQLNHEFLADEAVIENYQNTPVYQRLLLEKASQSASFYLTSQFNYLITKKRLIMMTKQTSAKMGLYKKVAILPLLAAAIFLFSQKAIGKNEGSKKTTNATYEKSYKRKLKDISKSYRVERKATDTSEKVIFSKNSYNIVFQKSAQDPLKYVYKTVPQKLDYVRFMINYPSTKTGASPAQLKEYAAIEAKYLNADEKTKFIKYSDISPDDRAKMEDLFALMSKEQQKKQKIAFTYGMPFKKNVPTQAQLNTWANDRQYKITIDGKLSSGAELAKHKAADFSRFYKAHIEWQVHRKYKYQHYEIQLMTTPYFTAKNKDREENSQVFNNLQTVVREYHLNAKDGKTVVVVK